MAQHISVVNVVLRWSLNDNISTGDFVISYSINITLVGNFIYTFESCLLIGDNCSVKVKVI